MGQHRRDDPIWEYWKFCRKQWDRLERSRTSGLLSTVTALGALFTLFSDVKLPGGSSAEGERQRDLSPAAERLEFVLWYTHDGFVPFHQFRVSFDPENSGRMGSGFSSEFQDGKIWGDSSNQFGHFLSATSMGYDPGGLFSQADKLDCIIGHELIGDRPNAYGKVRNGWQCFQPNLDRSPGVLENIFLDAVAADRAGNRVLRECLLKSIDPTLPGLPGVAYTEDRRGNSIQDLRLSLKGWIFGEKIRRKEIPTLGRAVTWLRTNLGP